MHDLDKQPIWVQELIARKNREIVRLTALVEDEGSVDYAGDLDWHRPVGFSIPGQEDITTLPQGSQVYFKQGRRRGYMSLRQRGFDQNQIQVMTVSDRIVVKPEVSNSIVIYMEDDR